MQEGQRHDRRRGEKRSEVWVATGSTDADAGLRLLRVSKKHIYIWTERPSSSDLCPSGLPRNLEFIKNWVSQAVCQCAAVISAGLLESLGVRGGASLYRVQQLRASYLVQLSSR